MAPLHRINPLRIAWARDLIVRRFRRDARPARRSQASRRSTSAAAPDSSPSRWRGSAPTVDGLDPAPGAIEAARRHAEETGARLDLSRCDASRTLQAEPRRFDVVSAMEVVEHVADLRGSSPTPPRS